MSEILFRENIEQDEISKNKLSDYIRESSEYKNADDDEDQQQLIYEKRIQQGTELINDFKKEGHDKFSNGSVEVIKSRDEAKSLLELQEKVLEAFSKNNGKMSEEEIRNMVKNSSEYLELEDSLKYSEKYHNKANVENYKQWLTEAEEKRTKQAKEIIQRLEKENGITDITKSTNNLKKEIQEMNVVLELRSNIEKFCK